MTIYYVPVQERMNFKDITQEEYERFQRKLERGLLSYHWRRIMALETFAKLSVTEHMDSTCLVFFQLGAWHTYFELFLVA